jgi:hypothetical protein
MSVPVPTTVTSESSSWTNRLPRLLLEEILGLTILAWGGFVVTIAGIIIGINFFDEITQSIWDFATQAPGWYALAIGFYLTHGKLPLYVAFGQTRREFALRGGVFIVIFVAVLAALMAVGFLLERILYRLNDWPQVIQDEHLFTSATQVPTIFAEYALIFLAWTLAGALIGASFYTSDEEGAFSVIVAIIAVSLVNIAVNASWGPTGRLVERFFSPDSTPVLVSIVLYVVTVAGVGALTWRVVRDIPLRGSSS